MKKTKAKAAKRGEQPKIRREIAKRGRKSGKGYNLQIGQLTGRTDKAQKRLERRAQHLMTAEGLSKREAMARARKEMRANPHSDWRKG
jgi:uncharacterized protein YoaH (UPF0181 family)